MLDKNNFFFNIQYTRKNNQTKLYKFQDQLSNLIKPDLSSLISKENTIIPKTSYKTKKVLELNSPVKTPKIINSFPYVIKGRDLFGVKQGKNYCKKLTFDNYEKELNFSLKNEFINKSEINSGLKNKDNNEEYNSDLNNKKNGLILLNYKINNNRMDNDYTIIKTISKNKDDVVYQVKENLTKKIFCIKKISEKTNKNNFYTLLNSLKDIQKENRDWSFNKTFCMKYIDYWIENQKFNSLENDINYLNKNIYILTDYFIYGDIFDYLEKLNKKNYKFTSDFYWDMIFEMMMGLLYIHKKGYIHFDIKPTNFLVDNNEYIILNDFGLSHKIEELSNLKDIIEGDSKYISKELFEGLDNISIKNINNKTDVFSLGLTILEILAKIELPSNGKMWRYIRDCGLNFLKKIIISSNIIHIDNNFFVLIKKMISPINERPSLIELIEEIPELRERYFLLRKNVYKKLSKNNFH